MKSTARFLWFVTASLAAGVLIGRYLPRQAPLGAAGGGPVGAAPTAQGQTPASRAMSGHSFEDALAEALAEAIPGCREQMLFRLGETLALAEIPRALDTLAKYQDPQALEVVRHLLGRWAQSDPGAAMKYAMGMSQAAGGDKAVDVVLDEWLAADAAGALQWAKALPPGPQRSRCLKTVFVALAATDPQRALSLLNSVGNLPNQTEIQETIVRQWAERDPVAAATAADKTKWVSRDTFGELARRWALNDPRAALAWAGGLPSQQARRCAIDGAMGAWADADLPTAVMYATNLPPQEQVDMMGFLAQRLASTNMEAALNWATNLPTGYGKEQALRNVIQALVKTSPADAAPLLGGLNDGDQCDLAESVAAGWYKQDPAGATAWIGTLQGEAARRAAAAVFAQLKNGDLSEAERFARGLSDDGLRADYLNQTAALYAGKDLDAAVNWVSEMPSGRDKASALEGLVQTWAGADPRAAAKFAQSLPSGEFTANLASGLAGKWAAVDPAGALEWGQSLPPGSMQTSAITSAVKAWAPQSPKDAAAYVASLPAGPLQGEGIGDVATAWANSDPKAAANWVSSFAQGGVLKQSAGTVLSRWAIDDPEAAAQWADSLPKGMLSSDAAGKILVFWANRDPQAASRWVDSCGISPTDLMSGAAKSLGLPEREVRNIVEESRLSDWAKQQLLAGGQ